MAAGVLGKHTHVFACVEEGANGRRHCFTHNQVCAAVDRVDDIYLWTPPCRKFSVKGRDRFQAPSGGTVAEARAEAGGFCVLGGLHHLAKRTPRLGILENPEGLDIVASGASLSPWDV